MTMKAISQHVHGKLLTENGRFALLLLDSEPTEETAVSLYLRFAFVTMGREEHIFPASILDDWGKERRGLGVYAWVAEFGEQFPRGEIFGFEQSGTETQCFLRGLELYAKYPLYVYTDRKQSVSAGALVEAVLLPDVAVTEAVQGKRPSTWKRPLSHARVSWWHVPPALSHFDFALLPALPETGV
ncbi:MAG: hypothetical protein R3E31_07240 [Chloroflexota bacterium]